MVFVVVSILDDDDAELIVLPNVSSVVSSSRGCCEKTEKKTPPLSGGALIRADREREFYAGLFCVAFRISFPLLFFAQNGTFAMKMMDS
jgi:hypothetical protein